MLIQKCIDDKEYEFERLGAKASLKLFIRISKIIGGPLSMIFENSGGKGKLTSLMSSDLKELNISKAIKALMENVDADDALEIIEQLTAGEKVLCDGKKINFNTHYEGELPHLFKVVTAAFEVQYGNFFDAFLAKKDPPTSLEKTGSDQLT